MEEHQRVFKLASILLHYPDQEWVADEDLWWEVQALENRTVREKFSHFLAYLKETPMEGICENYVDTFDLNDKTTLYLTYTIFGENQERGSAFLKLKDEFYAADLPLEDDELPDFLPLILEFASIARDDFTQKVFLIHKRAIDQLLTELVQSGNPYQWVLEACTMAIDSFLEDRKAS
ncbi:nitrate reductase molybdenum cofactor assembly chaperone [Brevibacillus sp. SYSU BS000544]|uniref:nitrate reductase molybdenum cofactor assembly chaperone n=1 Tax=Brevibacillus sp. SYSU BS000544 TaxID=3416443 RepID=UPI003CE5945D